MIAITTKKEIDSAWNTVKFPNDIKQARSVWYIFRDGQFYPISFFSRVLSKLKSLFRYKRTGFKKFKNIQ